MTGQSKKRNLCVPKQFTPPHFQLFYILMLVLSTILIQSTTWIRWRMNICGLQACVYIHQHTHSQDYKKLDRGLGMGLRIHLIWLASWTAGRDTTVWQLSEIWCATSVKKPECSYVGLMRSVSYFIRSVVYFNLWGWSVNLWSWSANICWQPSGGVAGWAQE